MVDRSIDSGVQHGSLLLEFTEAVLGEDDERLERARRAVRQTLGDEKLVDAAGAVASFNAVVKIADGTGLQVDAFRKESADAVRAELKLPFGPKSGQESP